MVPSDQNPPPELALVFHHKDRTHYHFTLEAQENLPTNSKTTQARLCRALRRVRQALTKAEDDRRLTWFFSMGKTLRQKAPWAMRSPPHAPLPETVLLTLAETQEGLRTVCVVSPTNPATPLDLRRGQRYLRRALLRCKRRHLLWAIANLLLLPLSALLTVLPGPNVFFFYNAYRLLVHLLCLRAAKSLLVADGLTKGPEGALSIANPE